MKRLLLGSVTLFAFVAAGPVTLAAPNGPNASTEAPLVYKTLPPTQLPKANPVRLRNPPNENDLFREFLEWLKTQPPR